MSEYIEREALLKHAIALNSPHELGENVVPISDIEDAPAADVARVVRGRWIYDRWCEFKCSVCGTQSKSEPRCQENYCPNCGCKMDKEDET